MPRAAFLPRCQSRELLKLLAKISVALTILLTVYGQIVVKMAVLKQGPFPNAWPARFDFLVRLLLNPWVWSAFAAAFLAAVSWMIAMTRLDLNVAYPFMSLAFVLVFALGVLVFHEPLSAVRITGIVLIVLGLICVSR
jgi:multidrug transporter EmrE-like cation transporter